MTTAVHFLHRLVLVALIVCCGSIADAAQPQHVSMFRLLGNPESFNGQVLTVSGYLHRSSEGVIALYPDAGSAEAEVTVAAVVLLVQSDAGAAPEQIASDIEKSLEGYVLVRATFDQEQPLPRGYSGILRSVEALRTYPLIKAM